MISEFAAHMLLFDKMLSELDCAHVHIHQQYFEAIRWIYAQAIIAGTYE